MFPTLSNIFEYLFNVRIPIPVQTFGFFVALAFVLPYFVFRAEFKRKEADGRIHPYIEKELTGMPASWLELLVNGLLGFVFGYKVVAAVLHHQMFLNDPVKFLFSAQGNWPAGILSGAAFVYWIYTDRKKQQLPEPKIIAKLLHPYELTGYLVFALGFVGFIGAKLFDVVEHHEALVADPVEMILSRDGFNFYGGLVFGALTYLYICQKKGMKLIHLADIGSPGMMLAYAVGRIGCHLSGDGDWGIINSSIKPGWLGWLPDWMWSFRFPHNAIDAGVPIDSCIGEHCMILARGVYPTSFYEAAVCLILFGLMWAFRRQITIPGLMFYLYLILNGIERYLIEQIRITDKHYFLAMAFTQAELIAVLFITGGITGIIYILTTRKNHRVN
ncbi:prolipoprotein diacylglyceryl transferase [Mucilaginibacter myungsuensis]|uniref:Prolipoprotein diacylglyceryl transferase n=1 Tax=Mucilaginibacter myungsuensis TaxID=649104 RepID=A0A929PYQ3_9SPHI|nr:prolipoprotein diacylglyceryl transferase family protein [Mucilaginibacter myungsuensis]MBE9663695.1 prolipoprotein diacylglyceryl transferase [Mucilaginibacter myungsuensis]MDN3598981.1 prolipoprotein diacylglyceryl transferase [Mucilaginibacter myungsuensis]